MVKVVALGTPTGKKVNRFGFMKGQMKVPKDFKTMFAKEIEETFGLND
jgi:hypothetical protein